jgi:hypothetical protein
MRKRMLRKKRKKVMKRDIKRRKRRKGNREDCFLLFLFKFGFIWAKNHSIVLTVCQGIREEL